MIGGLHAPRTVNTSGENVRIRASEETDDDAESDGPSLADSKELRGVAREERFLEVSELVSASLSEWSTAMRLPWHSECTELEVEQLFGAAVAEELQEAAGEEVPEFPSFSKSLSDVA